MGGSFSPEGVGLSGRFIPEETERKTDIIQWLGNTPTCQEKTRWAGRVPVKYRITRKSVRNGGTLGSGLDTGSQGLKANLRDGDGILGTR